MLQNETVPSLNIRKKKTIIVETGTNWLDNIFYSKDDLPSLHIMGKPLMLYNIEKLLLQYDIDDIVLPEGFTDLCDIIQASFPSIQIDESNGTKQTGPDNIKILVNSVMTKPKGSENYVARKIVYPWDILKIMHEVLNADITETIISKNSSIAESAIVKGPCIIEDGVFVDDFSKIIGPIYMGKNARVGTGSLVRHSMMGDDTNIGFNCEIARSFFAGNTRVAHLDVVLDSIIGYGCWLGGFVGTTNVLLDKQTIRYKLDDVLVSTGLEQFGAVIGHGCCIGAGTIILPGRFVPPKSIIQAGTVFSK
ncbi:MAG: hypothetical protein ACREA1_08680 [Nitrosotalea sp.]